MRIPLAALGLATTIVTCLTAAQTSAPRTLQLGGLPDGSPSLPRVVLRIEAESAGAAPHSLAGAMRVVPGPNKLEAGYLEATAKAEGSATYAFTIAPADAGLFRLRGRAMAIADDDDTFSFLIDGRDPNLDVPQGIRADKLASPPKHVWDLIRGRFKRGPNGNYEYQPRHWIVQDVTTRVVSSSPPGHAARPIEIPLSPGRHTITFFQREYTLPKPNQMDLAEPYYTAKLDYIELVKIAEPGAPTLPGFKTADMANLSSVGPVRISPDGRRAAYTAKGQTWIVDLETKRADLFGEKGAGGDLLWSPDGRRVAYFGQVGKESGLVVAAADGSDARLVSSVSSTNNILPNKGARVTWSPDGRSLAFVSATKGPGPGHGTDPVVVTQYHYKPTSGPNFTDNNRLHIFVADLATNKVRQLTDGNHHEHSIHWSPRGDEIVFVSNRAPDSDRVFNYDLFAVRVSDGSVRRLTDTKSAEYEPTWSPDGKTIAYLGTRRDRTSSETTMEDTHVWLIDADGKNRRELGARIDKRQGRPSWSADGQRVVFTVVSRGGIGLEALPVTGGLGEVIVAAEDPNVRVASWSLGASGVIALSLGRQSGPPELFLARLGRPNELEQLTWINREVLSARALAPVDRFTFASHDGKEVECFLVKPLDLFGRGRSAKHPLILWLHGGPHSQHGAVFNHKAQVYAAKGYAVLMVNFRGSIGYGQAFADAIRTDQNGAEAKDALAAVDMALQRYFWIDDRRIGVEGDSYGGQLTNWLVTQTPRFMAAISNAGISNLVSFNYTSYYHDYLAVEFGGYPHEKGLIERLWERSPIRYAHQVRTPLMLLHGEEDNDVPIGESEQFFIALKDVGVETVLVRYPRAGHGTSSTAHLSDRLDRSIAWYEKHFAAAAK